MARPRPVRRLDADGVGRHCVVVTTVRKCLLSVSVALAVLLGASTTVASAAKTPTYHTYAPAGLGITFQLPSEWQGGRGADPNWDFQAISPGHVADLAIATGPTTLSPPAFAAAFANGERTAVFSGDSHATFSKRSMVVGTATQATEIIAKYRGVGDVSQRPGAKLAIVMYGFVHHGKGYILHFTTTDTWLPKLRAEFRHSAKSVRFPFVA
jgi:hypothetical protein